MMKTLIKKLLREGLIKETTIKTLLYHGTKYNFDKFDLKFFNAGSGDGGWLGRGVYLTNDYEYAESYGNVLECKVNINNPYIITDFIYSRSPEKLANDLGVNNSSEITSKLIKEGYDSVILTYPDKGHTKDGEYDKFIEICVFDPNNVEVINTIGEGVDMAVSENMSGIDKILDKINQSGINSLSDFEKKVLDNANTDDDMDIIVKNWLDTNYSGLETINQTRNSFGKTKPFILFLDNDGELVMEFDVNQNTIYLPYQDIRKYLGEHFDSKTFQMWFYNTYKIKPKKISNLFINQMDEGEIVYHGSPNNFDEFKVKQGTMFDTDGTAPIFLTTDKDNFAKYYAKENGCIYTIELDDNIKLFDFRKMVDWWELKPNDYGYKLYDDMNSGKYDLTPYNDDVDKLYDYIQSGEYSILERKWFFEWLKDNNYDGAYVVETKTLNLFVFSPNKFKIVKKECK